MSARLAGLVAVGAVLAGCAVGPSYQQPAPVAPAQRVGGTGTDGRTRGFFDSLATARAADSSAASSSASENSTSAKPAADPAPLAVDSMADVSWLNLFRDTTLVGLVETAVRENRDVRAAMARIREFRANVGLARSDLFPSVSANAIASRNRVAIGSFPATTYNVLRTTADLAWELDFWGRTRRGIEAARADLDAQDASRRAVLLSVVSDVAGGYLSLLELDQERAIAQRTLDARQAILDLARRRFQQGVISELDVRQFEAQVAVPAAALAQAERARAVAEHRLSVLLGATPRSIPRGPSLADAVAALQVPDSLPGTLVGRRPDVEQAERAFAAATARIGVAQAARLPTVSITGSYGTQGVNTSSLFTSNGQIYQIQGGISLPLFTGGRVSNEIEVARARAEQARVQYEKTVLVALQEAGDALAGVRSARDEAAAQQTQAQALRRAVALAERRYRSGVASYVEVLEAQRSLFDAELGLSRAQLQQLSAAVQLYRALGGSWSTPNGGRR